MDDSACGSLMMKKIFFDIYTAFQTQSILDHSTYLMMVNTRVSQK